MRQVTEFLQANPYLFAGAICVGSVIAALIVDLITTQVLMRLTRKTRTVLDDQIVGIIRRPLFWTVLMIGISVAVRPFDWGETGRFVANRILMTLVVLTWMQAGLRISTLILSALSRRMDDFRVVQPRTVPLFDILVKTVIFGGAAYGILIAWRVDVTAWMASAGILGIAIGFAAKDTLSNLFSGIFILADAPYKLGDFIVLDSGERGQVTDIGIRSTRLLTRDDIQIIVPNAAIANAKIVNETGGPHDKERVRVKVGVAYGSDVDHVRRVLMKVAEQSKYVVPDPEPRVRFRAFGDSALNFELLCWIEEPLLRGRALDDLNTATYKQFKKENIQIPFPQRDVHLHQE